MVIRRTSLSRSEPKSSYASSWWLGTRSWSPIHCNNILYIKTTTSNISIFISGCKTIYRNMKLSIRQFVLLLWKIQMSKVNEIIMIKVNKDKKLTRNSVKVFSAPPGWEAGWKEPSSLRWKNFDHDLKVSH